MQNDPKFVQDGKITPEGMTELKKRMPFATSRIRKRPEVEKAPIAADGEHNHNYWRRN